MKKLTRLMRVRIIYLVIILCFLRKSATFEALTNRNASETSSDASNWESTMVQQTSEKNKAKIIGAEDLRGEIAAERDSKALKNENPLMETQRNFEQVNKHFNPFMSFPFFPFHVMDLKRYALDANSSEKAIRPEKDNEIGGGRPPRKPKPFLFLDFAFNIQEIPVRNQTSEQISSGNVPEDSLFNIYTRKANDKREGKVLKGRSRNEDLPFDLLDDDWSLFDDLPLLPRGVDDFLPKSKLRFLDLPYRGKEMKKQSRSRRDKPLVPRKKVMEPLLNIFDQAMSRMKREMKKTVPLWEFMTGSRKTIRSEDHKGSLPFLDDENLPLQDSENNGNKSSQTNLLKPISDVNFIRKSPVFTGKVVKIGEIHIRDDYPKSKKKRRKSSVTGKKEKQDLRENSVKLRHADQPLKEKLLNYRYLPASLKDVFLKIHEENSPNSPSQQKKEVERVVRRTQDAKILDLMAQWDRREMEEELQGKKSKTLSIEMYNKKEREAENVSDGSGTLMLKDKGFKYVGQIPRKKEVLRNSAGFEVLKPQQSSRRKRQENDGGGTWENVTASKDEIRQNITRVLGQFFSMIKKLGESKNLHNEKENQDIDGIIWPELGQLHGSRPHATASEKRMREERQAEADERDTPAPVADLNYLFLSVTLPTTVAFTLLLVICFMNLRPTSWLCQKVFQPRNLYVVEGDVEKSRLLGIESTVKEESYKKKESYKSVQLKEEEDVGKSSSSEIEPIVREDSYRKKESYKNVQLREEEDVGKSRSSGIGPIVREGSNRTQESYKNIQLKEEKDVRKSRSSGIEPIFREDSYRKKESYKNFQLKEEDDEQPEVEGDDEKKNEKGSAERKG